MDTFTIQEFRAWLVTGDPDRIVGTGGKAECCPLLNFIVANSIGRVPLPRWANTFMDVLDQRHWLQEVTSAQALDTLATAEGGWQ